MESDKTKISGLKMDPCAATAPAHTTAKKAAKK
jgi:hypothetical protein